ncbi:MAG: L,D-transpeptidase family protein, partial [Rhabdaerophilum calidifontis]
TQTPQIAATLQAVDLLPYWHVPNTIAQRDLVPTVRKDPGYLAKARIRIFGASGAEIDPKRIDWGTERATAFTLRQESGAGNALGQLRIDMPNREAVYMHDTPSKRLFARDDRFHSSGCVRVENVRDLAAWILAGQQGWDRAAIDAAIASGARRDIRPAAAIPVIWTYLTGYVTPDGQVHFRPDVYGRDLDDAPALTAGAPVPAARPLPLGPGLDSAGLDAMLVGAARLPVQRIDP